MPDRRFRGSTFAVSLLALAAGARADAPLAPEERRQAVLAAVATLAREGREGDLAAVEAQLRLPGLERGVTWRVPSSRRVSDRDFAARYDPPGSSLGIRTVRVTWRIVGERLRTDLVLWLDCDARPSAQAFAQATGGRVETRVLPPAVLVGAGHPVFDQDALVRVPDTGDDDVTIVEPLRPDDGREDERCYLGVSHYSDLPR